MRRRSSATALSFAASQASRKPPRPFDRYDVACAQQRPRLANNGQRVAVREGAIGQWRAAWDQLQRRPADGASIGLRMEAAVSWVCVLRCAGSAHGKARHGGGGAIVGDVLNDGVARAAVGAVGERVAVAPVVGVAEVAPAGVAGACVGRNQREGAGLLVALKNGKACAAASCDVGDCNGSDRGKLRRFCAQRSRGTWRSQLRRLRSQW